MTEPMYCPMSFQKGGAHGTLDVANECTPDCAWAVKDLRNDCYACGMLDVNLLGTQTNWRPLKDDAE